MKGRRCQAHTKRPSRNTRITRQDMLPARCFTRCDYFSLFLASGAEDTAPDQLFEDNSIENVKEDQLQNDDHVTSKIE